MIRKKLRNINIIKKGYRGLRKIKELIYDKLILIICKITGKPFLFSHYARIKNFGDSFNKDLLSFFNVKLIYKDNYRMSQVSLVGSILQQYKQDYNGYVLGSGFIAERFKRLNNSWDIKIIRGPLSAKQCEAKGDFIFGDPGILASLVFTKKSKKIYRLGILPHSSDYDEIKKINFGNDVKLISARRSAKKVAYDILQCENVASSSLHGLIFADSYGIPNVHLKFGDRLIGGVHKFHDYYLGMGLKIIPKPLIYSKSLNNTEIIKNCMLNFTPEFINYKQKEITVVYNDVLNKLIKRNL